MKAIYKREMKAYFTNPIGYVVIAIMWIYSSMLFSTVFSAGSSDITSVFSSMFSVMLFILPILTMRTFSEEKRQKTDQLYMTAPTSLWGVVLGKFFAAVTVFMIGMSLTLIYMFIIMIYITPQWLVFLSNLLGALLLAAAFAAIGMLISACTESQIVSAIITFAAAILLILLDSLASLINIGWITAACSWVSFYDRYTDFTIGTLNPANILFFISMAGVFLFLTVRKLDRKRWA